ncbi:MAG: TetR/AcrR family transcriptional regulator [Sandaracinaceae bacterium]|nr:TetR/AcrR family transcriptional regulator [Sandaracinaceae bacterium]
MASTPPRPRSRSAGVSEGTLFKRFKTKHEMFHCALDIDGEGEAWERSMPERVGIGDPQEQLAQILKDGIEVLRIIVPLVLTSSADPSTIPAHLQNKEHSAMRTLRVLTRYFDAEMRLGRIRRQDPEIAARMVMAAAWHYAHFELMFGAMDIMPMPEATYIRGVVASLWHGLEPVRAGGEKP